MSRTMAALLALVATTGTGPMGGVRGADADTTPHGICQAVAPVRDAQRGGSPDFAFAVVNTSDAGLWIRSDLHDTGSQFFDEQGSRVVRPGLRRTPTTTVRGRLLPDGSRVAVLQPIRLLAPGTGSVAVVLGEARYDLGWLEAGKYRLEPTFLTPLYAADEVIVYPDTPSEFWGEPRITDQRNSGDTILNSLTRMRIPGTPY